MKQDTTKTLPPPVKVKLIGVNGNAFVLMGAWKTAARFEKWTPEQIKEVLDEAMSGDYSHLLATLSKHCKGGGF